MQYPPHQPVMLLPNTRYPNYQLFAVAEGNKPPEATLTIAILETFSWLRKRFRALDIPEEMKWPETSEYASIDCSQFRSFSVDVGYKVEVVWLPRERSWTLQIIEPDMGPDPGAESQNRLPVPGRLIETNIAYRIIGKKVECAFCTMISDPDGTTSNCEVYRYAVIKKLANNPNVELWHEWKLSATPQNIDSNKDIARFKRWLESDDRQMLAVISTQDEPHLNETVPLSPLIPIKLPLIQEESPTSLYTKQKPAALLEQKIPEARTFNFIDIAQHGFGYAQFFLLSNDKLDAFKTSTGIDIEAGDVILVDAKIHGGKTTIYKFREIKNNMQHCYNEVSRKAYYYPQKKVMTFANTLFINAAKIREIENAIGLYKTKEEVVQGYEKEKVAIGEQHKELIQQKEQLIVDKDKKLQRLQAQIDETERKNRSLRKEIVEKQNSFNEELRKKDNLIKWLNIKNDRPRNTSDVSDWVARSFTDQMIFHPKAVDEMDKVHPNDVDLSLLCDALEFLATDYRDKLIKDISEDEMWKRCQEKYKRYFQVTQITGTSPEKYYDQYHIKYDIGHKGKLVDTPLDWHLKLGYDTRIYFLYDNRNKLIVVGSLPGHKDIVSINM